VNGWPTHENHAGDIIDPSSMAPSVAFGGGSPPRPMHDQLVDPGQDAAQDVDLFLLEAPRGRTAAAAAAGRRFGRSD